MLELRRQMEEAINSITRNSIVEIKAMHCNPGLMTERTIKVMCLVLGHIRTYDEIHVSDCRPRLDHWNPPLPERMSRCNLDEIRAEARTHLQQLCDEEWFTPENMVKKSMTICGPFCAWLRAVNQYIILSQ